MLTDYDEYNSFVVTGEHGLELASKRSDAGRITHGEVFGHGDYRCYIRDSRDIAKLIVGREHDQTLLIGHWSEQ